ncbi:hypothetical protein BASA81_003132 [Batrachochytrium salamandrivorans]|nr:hypothetical protein BASA81_003132 [Batrachochytrium salamandrivorans]
MFSALQQRFARAALAAHSGGGAGAQGLSTEPAEFEAKYARLLQCRDTLRKTEANLRLHLKKTAGQVKQAKLLGKALGTSDSELKRLGDELNTHLEDDTLVQAITSKIQLLDDTVKQRRKLEDMRLVRDHNQQRLVQLQAKKHAEGSPEQAKLVVEVEKRQAKLDASQIEYDGHLAELTDALEFIDAQTAKDGPWALISVELEAFRAAAQRNANNVQQLFVGPAPGTYTRDPEAEKAAVLEEERMQSTGGGKAAQEVDEEDE